MAQAAQQTVLISGGTGMVGTALTGHLVQHGYRVIVLTRNPQKAVPNPLWGSAVRYAAWDVASQTIETEAVLQADALVHLAGAGVVAKPWTAAYKQEILRSRVDSSALLVNAIRTHGTNLKTVVSASAIGWYGPDRGGQPFTEDAPYAPGFLGDTCKAWEDSIKPAEALGKRLVIGRIGIVLSNSGGALPEFKKPLRFRVAGILGNGRQMVSWIHIDDLCAAFRFAIENPQVNGIYNFLAPAPVSNRTLTITLAECMYGKAYIPMPVPAVALQLMMGERSIEVLKSTTCAATKLIQAGFRFSFPEIKPALQDLVEKG